MIIHSTVNPLFLLTIRLIY